MAAQCLTQSPDSDENLELEKVISKGSLMSFDEWALLISEIEKVYPDEVEKICLVYNDFLSKFPLCHGYWRKYAAHMIRLCTMDKVVEVFEQAVSAATYSVGMWVDYCSFGMSAFEDPSDIQRLFKRAISFVGKDYLCHTLWDKYIHFEFSQQQWTSLAHIYIQTLKFPTKKLHQYYDSFKKLLTFLEDEITSLDGSPKESKSELCSDGEIPMTMCCKDDKIYCIIKDMMDSSVGLTSSVALKKYKIIGEQLYDNACELYSKISSFEANIQRYYFDVRPLDADQLQNWHDYLDFIELQGDFDWAVKLYERCLIVCANYPDYWMRYVDFMEVKGGREIASYSLDRATDIYLKCVPAIHLFNARYKEQIGDVLAARAAYIHSGKETDLDFVESVISKANMEKRLGNMESAFSIYKEALEMATTEEKLIALPILYVHFSRLNCMSTNGVDAARDVLIDGIRTLPQNKLLLEELIKFSMMHGGRKHMDVIDSIIADALSPRSDGSQGLSAEDAEDVSNLYLEFLDYCGTIHDVRKAWKRHIKLFPGSTRIDSHQRSNKYRRPLDLINGKREEVSVAMPNQASRDCSSNSHAHLTQQNKKVSSEIFCDDQSDATNGVLLSMENHITQSTNNDMSCLQIVESDDKAEDNARELPLAVSKDPRDNDHVKDLSSADLVEVEEESTKVNIKKNCFEFDMSSENLLHQTASGNQPSQASSNDDVVFSLEKCKAEIEESKPLSVTSTSLNPNENANSDSRLMTSQECGAISESWKSNSRAVIGCHTTNQDKSASAQDSESAQVHIEINNLSSTCHQDHKMRRPLPPPHHSRNRGGNLHPMRNTGKFHRGPKYGNRGYSHRKQHQQRQLSPKHVRPPEGGAQLPVTPGCSQSALQVLQCNQRQNQFQATATTTDFVATHRWPIQNIQIQNSLPQPHLPANPASHVQYGYMQNGQDYNQMWQQYYYQQQLQLQQHYMQSQQPYPQECLQQIQQHSQLEPLQPQQLQQMQLQQQVLLQQQQQQYFQQQQPQQQDHPVYLQQLQPSTQSNSNPVADQGQAIVTSQPQQQEHPVYLQQQPQQQGQPVYLQQLQPSIQSCINPVADQGQAIVTSQGHKAILAQQSGKPGLVSSPVLNHPQEKSTQEE